MFLSKSFAGLSLVLTLVMILFMMSWVIFFDAFASSLFLLYFKMLFFAGAALLWSCLASAFFLDSWLIDFLSTKLYTLSRILMPSKSSIVYLDASFVLNCFLLRLFIISLSFSAASEVAVSRYVTRFFYFSAISLSRILLLYSLKSWLSSEICDPSSYSSTSIISNFTVFFFGSADLSFGSPVSYLGISSSSELT